MSMVAAPDTTAISRALVNLIGVVCLTLAAYHYGGIWAVIAVEGAVLRGKL
jgi:hypothetical protein